MFGEGSTRRSLLLAVVGGCALAAAPGATVARADGGTAFDTVQCAGTLPPVTTAPGAPWAVLGNLDCVLTEGDGTPPVEAVVPVGVNGAFLAGACGSGVVGGGIVVHFPLETYAINYVAPVVAGAGPLVGVAGLDDDGGTGVGASGFISELNSCCPITVITCNVSVSGVPPAIAFEASYQRVP